MSGTQDLSRLGARTKDELIDLMRRPGLVHYIGVFIRPTVAECIAALQTRHFTQDSAHRDDLSVHTISWSDEEWVIASLPEQHRRCMESEAYARDLALLWGPPLVTGKKKQPFPYPRNRLFTIVGNPFREPCTGTKH